MDIGSKHQVEIVLVYILKIVLLLLLLTWLYDLCLWIHNSYLRIFLQGNSESETANYPEVGAVDIHQMFLRLWEDLGLWERLPQPQPQPQTLRHQRQLAIEKQIPVPEKYDIDGCNYKDTSKNSTSSCAICLEEFVCGDLFRVLPFCKHMYHSGGISRWFLHELRCPICRSAIN